MAVQAPSHISLHVFNATECINELHAMQPSLTNGCMRDCTQWLRGGAAVGSHSRQDYKDNDQFFFKRTQQTRQTPGHQSDTARTKGSVRASGPATNTHRTENNRHDKEIHVTPLTPEPSSTRLRLECRLTLYNPPTPVESNVPPDPANSTIRTFNTCTSQAYMYVHALEVCCFKKMHLVPNKK